ncbi:hypothetical protein PBI_LUCKY2013_239 [Mycobacterium phage Lucky2013]|uniref:Uncharacterized protein n=1 Tax=Mycobacterium phage Thibault TaxID=1052673 RepID=G1FGS9_9CAUD|nr:hypothetical protein [Acinetobacter baumannii]YP_009018225.1 hypothetical protein CL87_gp167 [Mycobacterium phage Thibault]YP_009213467.1 hypothetical protein AVV70_gp187 [Mycobacterium phage MiaZeal]ASD50846.1 hypothetical protein PORCELAIN_243 [Mycobacterium phage Porcelain]ASD53630.1 hypothetical protein PBI_LUCKY2013_239 [Mycobacterium phage Lucky2013]ASZ74314.1 hypothetical protein SEA_SQUINT_239 [Mycobacterium phage Squint]ATN89047.1 hypothetical protein SEA_DMPSTRDIVER_242 [Mycobact
MSAITIPSPIIRTDLTDWGVGISYELVCSCGCGIRAGVSYPTPGEAARAWMHGGSRQHPGTPVWNGEVIDA